MTSPIDFQAGLTVGTVESVSPESIEVVLVHDAPHGTALNARVPTRFPRLNGFVLIPSETGAVLSLISWVGVERDGGSPRSAPRDLVQVAHARRRLRLIPLATVVPSAEGLEIRRGVLLFPTVGDPVHLPTPDLLRALTRRSELGSISLGRAPLAGGSEMYVGVDALIGRHLAVLGNTGSGKSCSVASIIRNAVLAAKSEEVPSPQARVVVLDTNGEYANSFEDLPVKCRTLTVDSENGEDRLRVPGWLWNAREWISFTSARPGAQAPYVRRALAQLRSSSGITEPADRQAATTIRALHTTVRTRCMRGPTADFSARMDDGRLVMQIIENCQDLIAVAGPELGEAIERIRALADSVQGTRFDGKWWSALSAADWTRLSESFEESLAFFESMSNGRPVHEDDPLPFDLSMVIPMIELMAYEDPMGNAAAWVAPLVFRLENLLADRRIMSLADSCDEILRIEDWLDQILGAEDEGLITVVDLSLVPTNVLHLVVGVLGRLIFEAHERFRRTHGRSLPTVVVAEEAHLFLGRHGPRAADDAAEPAAALCRDAFERIAREGRKFGLSLVVASQRPSELSETILSQCSNFLVHRIVNDADQQFVRRLVPDSLGDLLRELPSLPSRAAILMGTAANIPTLIEMNELEVEHRPNSADPRFFEAWVGDVAGNPGWHPVAEQWAVHPTDEPEASDEEPF